MEEQIAVTRPDELPEEELLLPGNRSCAGCSMSLIYRTALKAFGKDTIITVPAGCLTVLHGLYHLTSINVNVIHTTFETTAASASGIVASLEAQGLDDKILVVGFAGDGGTADIGLQGLSAAAERNTNFLYVCYDNEIYSNTGTQRSGLTPYMAYTTTTPHGKIEHKKNIPMIMLAHNIPYIATTCASYPLDMYNKFKKAATVFKGTRYIQVLAPCPPGWTFNADETIAIGRLAVKTGVFPIYEIIDGKMFISRESEPCLDPSKRLPVEEYLKTQGRFKHVDQEHIDTYQDYINKQWDSLAKML
ncbi:MAG TPA: thiamine pyrophosphate-dependent enzyme [Candidatus Lokiarchaeia archaeon]|nr:thiamine pyrophosphate-dependent enzyme [Candidatus Lokiarchaeia archaeon]